MRGTWPVGPADQAPRHNVRLYFRSPLEYVENPCITQNPTDLVFERIAIAAVNLQRVIRI